MVRLLCCCWGRSRGSDSRVAFPPTGSIREIPNIPLHLKDIFMTAWEIDPKIVVDMAADRGPFIDQTQSMSLTISLPNPDIMVRVSVQHRPQSLNRARSWNCRCMRGDVA